jgi:hypothetical protein
MIGINLFVCMHGSIYSWITAPENGKWLIFILMCDCRYQLEYQEAIPCEQMVSSLCDLKQAYTQFGGKITLW